MTLGYIIFLLLWGFIVGGLARLAVPGPDPMPIWMTIALGLGGSIIGKQITFNGPDGFPVTQTVSAVSFDGTGIPPHVHTPVFTAEEFANNHDAAFDQAINLLTQP